MNISFTRWRTNFWTGLAIVLPAIASIAILWWLFGGVTNFTDKPLVTVLKWAFPDPADGGANLMIYKDNAETEVYWYWKVLGITVSVILVGLVGAFARIYIGKKIIATFHQTMLRIPMLNKIYGAVKQVNDAFTTNNKSSFKQVVMVEFPSKGLNSIGFITGENHPEVADRTGHSVISIFVPTTPNPTTGFLILVEESQLTRLQMPVSEGIKYIMSLGSVAPPYDPSNPSLIPVSPPNTATLPSNTDPAKDPDPGKDKVAANEQ